MGSERSRGHGLSQGQAGNTLVLFPVALLIVLGLGAAAIDGATLFLGQRRLTDLATAVANDAVAGIDLAAFYLGDGELRLDPARVRRRADGLVAATDTDRGLVGPRCDVEVAGTRARVVCEAHVRPILAPLWAIGERHRITATETAEGRCSPSGSG